MSGRHTNINHFLSGVQNLDSSQSDKNCELEVHVEFGFKRRMWARLEICKRFLKLILSKLWLYSEDIDNVHECIDFDRVDEAHGADIDYDNYEGDIDNDAKKENMIIIMTKIWKW